MEVQLINLESPYWLQIVEELPHDFYHLPEYHYIESIRTNSIAKAVIISESENIFFVPYLLRNCSHLYDVDSTVTDLFDAISPYGYSGILLNETAKKSPVFINSALKQLKIALSEHNICSLFLRLHPILNKDFDKILQTDFPKVRGKTISIDLKLTESEIWLQTRSGHRTEINRCKRSGMDVKMVPFKPYINEFISIYAETMHRVEANNLYYFDLDYFLHLSQLKNKVYLCIVEWKEEIICAGLFTECDGIVQYHLSGTRNQFIKQAPTKLMLDYVRFWAKERGNKVLHLGGGVGSTEDSLYKFKAGFSQVSHDFMTLSLITDQEKYDRLVKERAKSLNTTTETIIKSDFFPAYRIPAIMH
jgi:hypothetical protein